MKNLKKLMPLFALLIGFGLVISQSAFKYETGDRYVYKNTTEDAIDDVNSWDLESNVPTPSCDNTLVLPCIIEITEPLESFLKDHSTADAIMNSSASRSTKGSE